MVVAASCVASSGRSASGWASQCTPVRNTNSFMTPTTLRLAVAASTQVPHLSGFLGDEAGRCAVSGQRRRDLLGDPSSSRWLRAPGA